MAHLSYATLQTLTQRILWIIPPPIIQSWLKALKGDVNMVLVAAAKAEKAVEYILKITYKERYYSAPNTNNKKENYNNE